MGCKSSMSSWPWPPVVLASEQAFRGARNSMGWGKLEEDEENSQGWPESGQRRPLMGLAAAAAFRWAAGDGEWQN